jgi:cyclopropane fatty-acyl-phospholipid synthase-like methyltransferase
MLSKALSALILSRVKAPTAPANSPVINVKAYYETTGRDYTVWSKQLNMHFGYWTWGTSLLRREPQLQNMTNLVIAQLGLEQNVLVQIGDFGCGYGAAARYLAQQQANVCVSAITVVPCQIAGGDAQNQAQGLADRVTMIEADYTQTGLPSNYLDAAYAMESACHDAGKDKAAVLTEMLRTLKPGGSLVISDGFRTAKPLPAWFQGTYRRFCDGWALPEMGHIDAMQLKLKELGCTDIAFTDISWRVAPSVAHIPWVAGTHTIIELWRGKGKLEPWRKKHIEASVLTMLLGLALPWFRYGVLTAKKANLNEGVT